MPLRLSQKKRTAAWEQYCLSGHDAGNNNRSPALIPSAERTTALQPQIRNGITLLPKRGVMVTSEQVYRLLDEEGA